MVAPLLQASIDIDAPPSKVWELISDFRRMPQWSPQCRWMRQFGPLRTGARTVNFNRRNRLFWPTTSTVVFTTRPARLPATRSTASTFANACRACSPNEGPAISRLWVLPAVPTRRRTRLREPPESKDRSAAVGQVRKRSDDPRRPLVQSQRCSILATTGRGARARPAPITRSRACQARPRSALTRCSRTERCRPKPPPPELFPCSPASVKCSDPRASPLPAHSPWHFRRGGQ